MIAGLVSVTFRQLSPKEICELCNRAGLGTIEWGGDVHVPPDGKSAASVRCMSADYGLDICSYGSYYRVGQPLDEFKRCMDAANDLGTGIIRVWCGSAPSDSIDDAARGKLVDCLAKCCAEAQRRGLVVAPEFHGGTLTDSISSVGRLLDETSQINNLRFYWQPRWDWTQDETLRALEMVRPRLAHAHVFTWRHAGREIIRLPLAEGEDMWKTALPMLGDAYALMEFVRDDCPDFLMEDAVVLRRWISEQAK